MNKLPEKYIPDEELVRQIDLLGDGKIIHNAKCICQNYYNIISFFNWAREDGDIKKAKLVFKEIEKWEKKLKLFILKNKNVI